MVTPSIISHLNREGLGNNGKQTVQDAKLVNGGGRVDCLSNGAVAKGGQNADVQHGCEVLGTNHW